MKLSDWLPSVFVEGDGDDIQVTTKKFSQFPTASGENIQGVGIKDGNNVKFDLTTDSIKVNPNPFRNAKGQFIGTPEELEALKNQRDVNEFFYNAINDIEMGDVDLPPGTIVSEDPPEDPEEGLCWYDTGRLELFVYANDGWFPCSPLGARVEAGEVKQQQIIAQINVALEEQTTLRNKVADVEQAVEDLDQPSFDPTGLATIDYVDIQLESLRAEIADMKNKPPGRPFMYTTSSLGAGEFSYTESGGKKRMRLNKTDADGFDWKNNSGVQDSNTSDHYSTAFTIRYWDEVSKTWKMKMTGFLTRIDWHKDDAYFYIKLDYSEDGLAGLGSGLKYYITVGGII
jgi:hypothetical protein